MARVLLEFGFLYPKESPSQPQKASVAKPLPTSADPVSRALSKLPLGSAAVAAPKSVRQYDDFEVTLRLAKEPLAENIDAAKGESPAGYVMQGVPDVRISPRMRAELYGKDFLIDAAAATERCHAQQRHEMEVAGKR